MAVNEDRRLKQWGKTSHLYACAERLKMAQIENDQAENVIHRFDDYNTLFYVDPPYQSSTRTTKSYPDEMTDTDHIALSDALHSIKGMALISGYDSPLYRELYADWQCVTKEARTVNNVKRIEHLWINERAQEKQAQRRLFE